VLSDFKPSGRGPGRPVGPRPEGPGRPEAAGEADAIFQSFGWGFMPEVALRPSPEVRVAPENERFIRDADPTGNVLLRPVFDPGSAQRAAETSLVRAPPSFNLRGGGTVINRVPQCHIQSRVEVVG